MILIHLDHVHIAWVETVRHIGVSARDLGRAMVACENVQGKVPRAGFQRLRGKSHPDRRRLKITCWDKVVTP